MERFESFDLEEDGEVTFSKQMGRAVARSSLSAELEVDSNFSYAPSYFIRSDRNHEAMDEVNMTKIRWEGDDRFTSDSDCSLSYHDNFDKLEDDEIHEDSLNDESNDESNDDNITDDKVLSAGNLIRVIINNQFIFQERLFDSDGATGCDVDTEVLINNIKVAEAELGYVAGMLNEEMLCKQHLLIAAAEDDGSLMDDLPAFSSHTDILETGISDFNLLLKSVHYHRLDLSVISMILVGS